MRRFTSFVPPCQQRLGPKKLIPGEVLRVVLQASAKSGARTIPVSAAPAVASSALLTNKAVEIEAVTAGQLVECRVTAQSQDGVEVMVLGFTGSIHWRHLAGHGLNPDGSIDSTSLKGSKVCSSALNRMEAIMFSHLPPHSPPSLVPQFNARIIYADPSNKTLCLSQRPEHVEFQPAEVDFTSGEIHDKCVVRRSDVRHGLLLVLPDGQHGWVPSTSLSEDKDDVPKPKTVAVGTNQRARVTGYNRADGVVVLTMVPSLLKAPYLNYAVSFGS